MVSYEFERVFNHVVKQTERDGMKVKEISAMYMTDFVDLVYNGGKSEDVKVVKI